MGCSKATDISFVLCCHTLHCSPHLTKARSKYTFTNNKGGKKTKQMENVKAADVFQKQFPLSYPGQQHSCKEKFCNRFSKMREV